MLKRNNWTNEEVMKILLGQKLCSEKMIDGKKEWAIDDEDPYNRGIEACINRFYDFTRDSEEDHGAMAFDVKDQRVYHIGPMLPQ